MLKQVYHGWWVVTACMIIGLTVGGAVFYGFTAFFEPIVQEFGWSYTQVSLAYSMRGLEVGLFAPGIGFLVDRFGSSKVVLFGMAIAGSGLILLSLTQSLAMFYTFSLLIALGAGGCTSTVLIVLVTKWFRKNLGKALGLMASGFGGSGLLIPLIVRLIEVLQWRTAFVILGSGLLILVVPLFLVVRHEPQQHGSSREAGALPGRTPSLSFGEEGLRSVFKETLKHGAFHRIAIAETLRIVIVSAVVVHVMPYLSSVGVPRSSAGFIATAIPVISAVGRFGFGWLGDIFDRRYVMAAAYCLMGIGILAFAYVHLRWILFLFLLLFPVGYGGGNSLRGAIVAENFGTAHLGRVLGMMAGIIALGAAAGPVLAGWAFDSLGSYRLMWVASSLLLVPAIGLIVRIRPHTVGSI